MRKTRTVILDIFFIISNPSVLHYVQTSVRYSIPYLVYILQLIPQKSFQKIIRNRQRAFLSCFRSSIGRPPSENSGNSEHTDAFSLCCKRLFYSPFSSFRRLKNLLKMQKTSLHFAKRSIKINIQPYNYQNSPGCIQSAYPYLRFRR